MMYNVLAFIGFIWVLIFFMGVLDIIHVRVYVGTEDKVIVSKDRVSNINQ